MYLLWPGIFVAVMEWPFSEQQAMLDVHGVENLLTVSEICSYWLTFGVHSNTYSACSVRKNIEADSVLLSNFKIRGRRSHVPVHPPPPIPSSVFVSNTDQEMSICV